MWQWCMRLWLLAVAWIRAAWLPAVAAVTVATVLWAWLPPVPRAELAVQPDAKWLSDGVSLVAMNYDDLGHVFVLHIWNIATGEMRSIYSRFGVIEGVAISADASVAILSADNNVRTWDKDGNETCRLLRPMWGPASSVAIAYSPESRVVAYTPHFDHSTIWDAVTGEKTRTLAAPAADMDARTYAGFVVGHEEGNMKVWDLTKHDTEPVVFQVSSDDELDSNVSLSRNGMVLVACLGPNGRPLRVWHGNKLGHHDVPFAEATSNPDICSDGQLAAITVVWIPADLPRYLAWLAPFFDSTFRSSVQLIDVSSGRVVSEFRGAYSAHFANHDKVLVVRGADGVSRVYDLPPSRSWKALAGWSLVAFGVTGLLMMAAKAAWKRRGVSV